MALSKIDVANMVTGATPVANGGTGLTSGTTNQFLKFTGSTTLASAADNTGITEFDQWRFTTDQTGLNYLASNLERVDTYGNGQLGTGMSESSGVFTFPSTGLWRVDFNAQFYYHNAASDQIASYIYVTTDNSSYSASVRAFTELDANGEFTSSVCTKLVDVTDTAQVKVKFRAGADGIYTTGNTNASYTYITFQRYGDT
jgi:hypothetical protein